MLVGRSLGQYHIVEKTGRGGMASVYKAQDLANDRIVAAASFSKQPDERIAIDDTSDALSVALRTWDLDLDGRSEILLHYEGKADRPHRYRLLSH